MKIAEAKKKIKVGSVLVDDCNLVYIVIDKLTNSIVTQSVGKGVPKDVGCEIITYQCIEREGWEMIA